MSAIASPSLPETLDQIITQREPAPHGNAPVRCAAKQDEMLLCSALESLAALEARFAADLGNAGLRKLRHALEALGAVYRTKAVDRIARRRSG